MIGCYDTDRGSLYMHCLVIPVSSVHVLGDDASICHLVEPFLTASMPVAASVAASAQIVG